MPDITVVGSANMDLVIGVERLVRTGETLPGGDLELFPGGKGANQACAAARLGGNVDMVAQVGKDSFGSRLIASLNDAGVDTSRIGRVDRSTGCAVIYVLPNGRNAIVISPGANATLQSAVALSRLDRVQAGGYVLAQLEIPLETVTQVLAEARSRGAVTILDPAPARRLTPEVLRNVDILTPNQTEAAILAGNGLRAIRDNREAAEVAGLLLQLGVSAVVVKMGESGCIVRTREFLAAVPGFRVTAVDTTAAGDVFNAALAVALGEGRPLLEAAVFANAAGAICVTRAGAQSSIPSRAELDAFLFERRHSIEIESIHPEETCSS